MKGSKLKWIVIGIFLLYVIGVTVWAISLDNSAEPALAPADQSADTNDDKSQDKEETEDPGNTNNYVSSESFVMQHQDYDAEVSPAFTAKQLSEYPTQNWITNGGNLSNQRYSPLDQINASTVKDLKADWVASLGSATEFKYSGEASPIVYDGVMYVINGADDVIAFDAVTGEVIWEYRPEITEKLSTVCCGWTSRGVAIGDGLVYVGLLDARLVALDQKTGEVVWETVVDEWQKGYTITSAPLYYDGKVYTGISGGEYGIRGRVTAFDASSGRELWRFYTIPGPEEVGHDSWPEDNKSWLTGGAPVWQTPAVDPELGMLYFSTGNAAPDVDGSNREGDNLFSSSIVAIDANTGEYRWHFQEVHHDIWDLDAPNPVILFDTTIDGKERKALGQAGKTGWIYFLDRKTGEPLIGIDETPVPQGEGQHTAATQPIPKGDAFVPQEITKEDVERDLGPDFEGEYGKIFDPFGETPRVFKPAASGGANWPPSAYSPDTELFYVLGNDQYQTFSQSDEDFDPSNIEEGETWLGSIIAPVMDAPVRGTITAMDVKTNKIVWQQKWDALAYSGAMTTAGNLLFVGHNDGRFIAYNATTGEQVWEFMTDAGVNAPPITYEVDGKQYISVLVAGNSLAGSKHGDSIWTFSLDGKFKSLDEVEKVDNQYGDPGQTASASGTEEADSAATEEGSTVDKGLALYEANCLACHGTEGKNGHNGPNLQTSKITADKDAVIKRVLAGGQVMPSFEGTLSDEDIDAIATYISEVVSKIDE